MSSILDQALRLYWTIPVGGDGSTQPYQLVSQQQNPPAPVQSITFYTSAVSSAPNSYIHHILVTFADSSQAQAGGGANEFAYTFQFQQGEVIQQCYLYLISPSDGRVAISFTTNLDRSFRAGDTSQVGTDMGISGSVIYGLQGTDGTDVDTIAFQVDVPITELEVTDLTYNVVAAGLVPQGTVSLDSVQLSNNTTTPQTVSVNRSYTVINASNWSITGGLKVGTKTTFKTGIPLVFEGKVEVSAELSFQYTYGRSSTRSQTFQYTAQVTVPANGQTTALVTATQGALTVAYQATLQVWYKDGITTPLQIVGTYTGVDSYNIVVQYSTASTEELLARRDRELANTLTAGGRVA